MIQSRSAAEVSKRDDGLVAIKKDTYIGCRYSMSACPYGVRSFMWKKKDKQELSYPSQVPGVVDKCDFCYHRWDNGTVPSCINTCPNGARTVGDLLKSEKPSLPPAGNVSPAMPSSVTCERDYWEKLKVIPGCSAPKENCVPEARQALTRFIIRTGFY
jgi:Fe-S-cluster-containing dehydrogenase component